MYFEVFDNGFIKIEKNEILIKINSKDWYIVKIFIIICNIVMLVKIIFVIFNLFFLNLENNCFVINIINIFDYYGLFLCKWFL